MLGGLWHGASMRFILWGALHGVSLAVHKFVMGHFSSFKPMGEEMSLFRRMLGMILTFHLVCLGWVFFRADTVQIGRDVLMRIFTDFHPEVFTQFIVGYPGVSILMATGYLLHFIPKHIDWKMQRVVTDSPMLFQALYLLLAIFVVIQVKSSGVVPFIYFQF